MTKEIIDYNPVGTCCKLMQVSIENGIVVDVDFKGGCSGNLIGIKNLIIGMRPEEIISKLKGIKCGPKSTSCPDQLAICLTNFLEEKVKSDSIISTQ